MMDGPASPNTRRLTAKRGAFSEKIKLLGVSSAQRLNVLGVKVL